MIFPKRLTGKALADLCHRLAISAESGIDIRRTWEREARNASGKLAGKYAVIRDGVAAGDTLAVSMGRTGQLFPRLFLEMVHIAEQTGSLAEVLHRLSTHYQRRAEMTRSLLAGLTWPLMQLAAAVFIVGLMIGVLGALDLRLPSGKPVDILGFGVTGAAALSLYIQIVSGVGMVAVGLVIAAKQGLLWMAPVERLAMAAPAVGPALQKVCLARLTWALHLTLNTALDLRRIVPLSLRATGSGYYTRWSKPITALVAAGSPLHEAFDQAHIFPQHFIESLQVAEESGQMVESTGRLSKQYDEEAQSAMATLTTVLGFVLSGLVMVIVAAMAIRMFQAIYLDAINDALSL
ncbi:MAG: type II secretion system F family protein [Planctomycetota bacterium]